MPVKREFLADTLGAEQVALMRAIKRALDPEGVLNPGKVVAMDDVGGEP